MKKILKENTLLEMSIFEHLEELRSRILIALIFFIITTAVCFIYIDQISCILQQPAKGIKFIQLAPGEYLFASIKVTIYTSILITSPFTIYQIVRFILPGLTKQESLYIIPILGSSIALFYIGLLFSYKILAPAALHFLIKYGSNIVEPIWSFEEYISFILILLFSTGIIFQVPILQIVLGIFNIISSTRMLAYSKYMIFISTIVSAVITPSTDPITQIILALALILLYLSGIMILKIINK
uniref:Sec-independent protein translocase component TatC n=1 Tax=Callithamnion tetricum TaxID=193179 RepID=A0A4D6WML7_9FLOR|nr:Sec-independent protein translocase component TatC [Callithamnion tetricum]